MTGSFRSAVGVMLLLVLCLLPASCASVRFMEDIADYEDAIADLEQEAARNPNAAQPLRDLGVIYLRTNDFAKANDLLQQAFARDPDDPKTLFHLGLANEALAKPETALRLYERYPEFSLINPYRRLMAGRYADVSHRIVREEIRARVADEARLTAERVEPSVVAVYPLEYRGGDAQYEALGRGMAELMTVDLSQVDALQIVERVRLQTLIDEIDLAKNAQFDPATAPRVGHLIGAGRLLGGSYSVLGGGDMQLDAALWESERADVADLGTRSSTLRNLFTIEKEIVFGAIDAMGITLTQEERERIEFIPTENLQAFLAFSRGLEREDAGAFDEAASYYEQALRLDPNFRLARNRADEAAGQAVVAGPVTEALVASYLQDPVPPLPTQFGVDPMGSRLQNLNTSVGSNLVPGQDTRKPATEGGTTTIQPPPPQQEPLQDPPPPPQSGGGG